MKLLETFLLSLGKNLPRLLLLNDVLSEERHLTQSRLQLLLCHFLLMQDFVLIRQGFSYLAISVLVHFHALHLMLDNFVLYSVKKRRHLRLNSLMLVYGPLFVGVRHFRTTLNQLV